jgi:hypothetical protein
MEITIKTHLHLIILVACLSLLVTQFTPFIARLKHKYKIKDLAPFDCGLCFSFWASLMLSFYIYGTSIFATSSNIFSALFISVVTPIVTLILERIINK